MADLKFAGLASEGRRFRLNNLQVFSGQPDELKSHDKLLYFRNKHTAHPVMGLEQSMAGINIPNTGDWTVAVLGINATAPPSDLVRVLDHVSEVVWNWVKQRGMIVQDMLLTKEKALGEANIKSNPKIVVEIDFWKVV